MPPPVKTPPPEVKKTPPAPKAFGEKVFGASAAPHASEYYLPPDKLAEADKMFDECGAIEITIRRTLTKTHVSIKQLEPTIVLANEPEPETAPLPPIFPKTVTAVNVEPVGPMVILPKKAEVFFGMPTLQRGLASRLRAMMGTYKYTNGPIAIIPGHDVDVARNIIATEFLNSGEPWLFMMDDDIIPPFGNPAMFSKITGAAFAGEFMQQKAVETMVNCGQKFVGAVYVTRSGERRPVTQVGFRQQNMEDQALVKKIKAGPSKELVKVPWVGLGCVAIHRDVFEAIMVKHPNLKDEASGNWKFFTFTDNKAEDVTFGNLATECGHPPHLHLGVVCGHIGEVAFLP